MDTPGVQTRAMAAKTPKDQGNKSVNPKQDKRRASLTSEQDHFEDATDINQSLMKVSPPHELLSPSAPSSSGIHRNGHELVSDSLREDLQAQINAFRTPPNRKLSDQVAEKEYAYQSRIRKLEGEKKELLIMLAEREDVIEQQKIEIWELKKFNLIQI